MLAQLRTAIVLLIVFTLLTGLAYPLAVTGVAQLTMPRQAGGSLIVRDGQVIGSDSIGQAFADPRYFRARPSAAGTGYDAAASGGSNLGPTSRRLVDRVATSTAEWQKLNPGKAVPVDLVTASGSGLDPDISTAAAEFQIPIVARARGLTEEQVRAAVGDCTTPRQWGFLGEPRVNVLRLNVALDAGVSKRPPAR